MFWESFWPAFWATLSGAILGIPVGILVFFAGRRLVKKEQAHTNNRRRTDTLRVIRQSLIDNTEALAILSALGRNQISTILFEPSLDVSSWIMGRYDIIRLVDNVGVRTVLARYFQEVNRLQRLVKELNDYTAGVNAAMGAAAQVRIHIKQRIEQVADQALAISGSLLTQIVEQSDGTVDIQSSSKELSTQHIASPKRSFMHMVHRFYNGLISEWKSFDKQ